VDGFILPARSVDGSTVVMLPEMLVGLMLEMVSGSEFTPKGGLSKLLEAHEAAEPMPPRSGVYGRGCYKDEPWGVVAIRKRLTSVRKFYERHLEGNKVDVNPGPFSPSHGCGAPPTETDESTCPGSTAGGAELPC